MNTPPLSDEQIQRLKRQLLKKGSEINAKLVDLLNGKEVSLERLLGGGKPGETKEERLRRFLQLVDSRLVAIRNGSYGRCQGCGEWLHFEKLEQVPWIDTCEEHAADAAV